PDPGRAARNQNGRVILYADRVTESMRKAMEETARRREIQTAYNKEHGITPQTVKKRVAEGLSDLYGMEVVHKDAKQKNQVLREKISVYAEDPKKLSTQIAKLRKQMKKASDNLEFEEAARIRDEIKRLEVLDLSLHSGEVDQVFSATVAGEE
ncbi:MAG: excinuclease ABC subunit UvrB, partial [Calothrix sp. SM1_5_4]|nr:excinuclease ABC subunit UvrB [Calothrix sp. SM1_5_4]